MPDNLIEVGRFLTSAEAALVRCQLATEGIRAELAGEAAAGWLWHMQPAIGGVRLLVDAQNAARAEALIDEIHASEESAAVGEFADEQVEVESDRLPDELIRAWRAALLGLFLLPPLLSVYSTWLLLRHRFFLDRCHDWRIYAASALNALMLALVLHLCWLMASPQADPWEEIDSHGLPIDLQFERESIPFHLLP